MKRLILLILLLAPVFASGQKRVYIRKDEFRDDIYLVERNGEIEAYFQLDMPSPYDSLFLLVTKKNCQEIHDYMEDLLDTYHRWSRTAKSNHVKDFKKDFDIDPPLVRFRWMERIKEPITYGYVKYNEYFTPEDKWLAPYFSVNNIGHCNIFTRIALVPTDPEYSGKYSSLVPINDNDISLIIRWTTDFKTLERTYNRKKPKMTNAEINALFD